MIGWTGQVPITEVKRFLQDWLDATFLDTPDFAKLRLMKNDAVVSPTMVLADVTEADFDGYAAENLLPVADWDGPVADTSGNVFAIHPGLRTFTGDTPQTTPNTIWGWYVTNAAGTVLHAAGKFALPFDFTVASAILAMELAFRLVLGAGETGADAEYGTY